MLSGIKIVLLVGIFYMLGCFSFLAYGYITKMNVLSRFFTFMELLGAFLFVYAIIAFIILQMLERKIYAKRGTRERP